MRTSYDAETGIETTVRTVPMPSGSAIDVITSRKVEVYEGNA